MQIPRVAALHDISGIGRCSLTVAISVLSSLSVQTCPVPMAVFSAQTGFPHYFIRDLTDAIPGFMDGLSAIDARFDGIYSGFLLNPQQIALTGEFIERFGDGAIKLIDPVMGDDGRLYPVFDEEFCRMFRSLIRKADIITPNLTEACLLTGRTFPQNPEPDSLWDIADALMEQGPATVIISGVTTGEHVYTLCAGQNGRQIQKSPRIKGSYSGTGDILASLLCGMLVRGVKLEKALPRAVRFLEAVLTFTGEQDTDPREGILYEPFLSELKGI